MRLKKLKITKRSKLFNSYFFDGKPAVPACTVTYTIGHSYSTRNMIYYRREGLLKPHLTFNTKSVALLQK